MASEDYDCVYSESARIREITKLLAPIVAAVESGAPKEVALKEFEAQASKGFHEVLQDDGVLYVGTEGYFRGDILGVEFTCVTEYVGCGRKYSACSGMFSGGVVDCKETELTCEMDH